MKLINYIYISYCFFIVSISHAAQIIDFEGKYVNSKGQLINHGNTLCVKGDSRGDFVVNLDTEKVKRKIHQHIRAVHPNDELLFGIQYGKSRIQSFFLNAQGEILSELQTIQDAERAIFSPSGRYIWAKNQKDTVFCLMDVATEKVIAVNSVFKTDPDERDCGIAAISCSDTYIAIVSNDRNDRNSQHSLSIYDTRSGIVKPVSQIFFEKENKSHWASIGDILSDRRNYYKESLRFAPNSESDLLLQHSDTFQHYDLHLNAKKPSINFSSKNIRMGGVYFGKTHDDMYVQTRSRRDKIESILALNRNNGLPSIIQGYLVAGKKDIARLKVEQSNKLLRVNDIQHGTNYVASSDNGDIVQFHEESNKIVQIYEEKGADELLNGFFTITKLDDMQARL